MTTKAAIRVEGLNLTVRKLKAVEVEAPDKVKELNRQAAGTVEATARPLVPFDVDSDKPHLLDTLRVSATRRSAAVLIGNNTTRIYAGVIHFGWPAHNIEANKFLYEALGQDEPQILEEYEHGMTLLLTEVGLL